MQTALKNFGLSALFSFLLILPFAIMEIINRRQFNEDFPYKLFFGLWLNLFAISLILLPILLSKWDSKHTIKSTQSVLIIGFILILSIIIISLISTGQENSELVYVFSLQVPSQLIAFASLSIPIIAAIIASNSIIRTLQAGGSIFAHPINLIIVILILSILIISFTSLIIDQWTCFIGVQYCD